MSSINEIEAAVQRDLSAKPISRELMDLLWLDPRVMRDFRETLQAGERLDIRWPPGSREDDLLYGRIRQHFERNGITVAGIDWALRVDALAEQAQMLGDRSLIVQGIEKWREALAIAPGCDLYLMSVGAMYGALGMHNLAERYVLRALELNPQSPRIARNLEACRSHM